jgi:general secretion pathway protein D
MLSLASFSAVSLFGALDDEDELDGEDGNNMNTGGQSAIYQAPGIGGLGGQNGPGMFNNHASAVPVRQGAGVQHIEKLILVEEALPQILSVLEQLTEKTILRDHKLPALKLSINIQKPVTKEEAILALRSLLDLNGVEIIPLGGKFLKAVSSKQALSQAPELRDASLVAELPSQAVCSKFFTLKYLNAPAFQKLIMPLLTPSLSSVIAFESSNSLLITDCQSNLQRIEDMLERVDRPLTIREEIFFYNVRNTQASALKERLNSLQNGGLKKYLYGTASFEADDRSNQLVIMVPAENLAFVRNIVENLDVDRDPLIRTEVFRIRHGAAKDLADVIRKVVENQRHQEERANTYRLAQQRLSQVSRSISPLPIPSSKESTSESSDAGEGSSSSGDGTQAIQFSKALSIEADERSNSILAYGTQTDISQIRSIISKLDIVLDQVRIEVVIAQVTLKKGQVSGLESFGISRDNGNAIDTGRNDGTDKEGRKIPIITPTIGTTAGSHNVRFLPYTEKMGGLHPLAIIGGDSKHRFALSAVFNKAREDENIKIMSAPTIVTTHNREASIEVGESQPIIVSSATEQINTANRRSEVTYKNIGLKLKVKPFIGSNGIIQMEIDQVVEQKKGSVTIDNNQQPIISKRQANSFVSVANQEVVVMAGLQERVNDFKKGKLWLLGDLPLVGDALFTSRSRASETTELIIFIKPTIIAQPLDEQVYLEKRAKTAGVYDDLKHYEEQGTFPEGSPFPSTTIEPVNSFDEPPTEFFKKKSTPSAKLLQKKNAPAANPSPLRSSDFSGQDLKKSAPSARVFQRRSTSSANLPRKESTPPAGLSRRKSLEFPQQDSSEKKINLRRKLSNH